MADKHPEFDVEEARRKTQRLAVAGLVAFLLFFFLLFLVLSSL